MSRCKALGVIPARLGSTRLPRKPLLEIDGRPMIEHTFRAAKRAQSLSDVLVASDSQEILDVIRKAGGKTARTSSECPTGTDRVVQAVRALKTDDEYDIIVNIQGDEPGVNPEHIDQCVEALRTAQPNVVMSTLATPVSNEEDAYSRDVVKCVLNDESNAIYFSRALIPHSKDGSYQPNQVTYLRHVGLYAFRKEFLLAYPSLPTSPLERMEELEQLRVLSAGYVIKVIQVESTLPGIDTEHDLATFTSLWPRP